MNDKLHILREKSMKLPLTPGVYIMKNKQGKIIYIGKAKKLKNRVSQYFGSQNHQGIRYTFRFKIFSCLLIAALGAMSATGAAALTLKKKEN